MSLSKKGSRNISVNGLDFLYKISKVKKKSDWREQNEEINKKFMHYASYYGLGKVKDITINIVIQLKNDPASSVFIKINTILIDGFLGAEQLIQIKPKFISELIKYSIANGWNPSNKENYRLNLLHIETENHRPTILHIPDTNEQLHMSDYDNLAKPIKIDY